MASKVKAFIKAKAGMNTSAAVMDALPTRVRQLCEAAVAKAQADGRKTVMDRDFVVNARQKSSFLRSSCGSCRASLSGSNSSAFPVCAWKTAGM